MRRIKLAAASLLLVSLAGPVQAAIAEVDYQDGFSAGGGNPATVAAAATNAAAGNCLFALTVGQGGTVNITDTAGNTFLHAGSVYSTPSTNNQSMSYSCNITGNAADVLTATWPNPGSGGFDAIAVWQFSGACSGTYVTQQTASGTSTAPQTTAIAPTNPSGVIFAFITNSSGGGGISAGSGFTGNSISGKPGYFFSEYKIVSGSTTPLGALSGSAPWEMLASVFNGCAASASKLPLYINSVP